MEGPFEIKLAERVTTGACPLHKGNCSVDTPLMVGSTILLNVSITGRL